MSLKNMLKTIHKNYAKCIHVNVIYTNVMPFKHLCRQHNIVFHSGNSGAKKQNKSRAYCK